MYIKIKNKLKPHQFKKWVRESLVIIAILGGLVLVLYFADFHQCKVEKRLGFKVVTPYLSIRPRVEVLMLNYVDSGGVFEKAGFRAGDIIINRDYRSRCGFLNSLDQPTGTNLWLEIVKLDDFDPTTYLDGTCQKTRIEFVAP